MKSAKLESRNTGLTFSELERGDFFVKEEFPGVVYMKVNKMNAVVIDELESQATRPRGTAVESALVGARLRRVTRDPEIVTYR